MRISHKWWALNDMSIVRHAAHAALLVLGLSTPALSQPMVPPAAETVSLSDPRFGSTFLSDGIVRKLGDNAIHVGPLITQFGWQFEKQFYSAEGPVTAMTEWVVLFGGLEQGVALPSLTCMVGLRTRNGAEFGVGPNLTAAEAALASAGGGTFRAGALNVPVNLAMVPSKSGVRVSVLSGFSLRRR